MSTRKFSQKILAKEGKNILHTKNLFDKTKYLLDTSNI